MIYVVIDFETVSGADLRKVGAARYWGDPTTEIICLCGYVVEGYCPAWCWTPGSTTAFLEELIADPEMVFVAHNAAFERLGWEARMAPVYGLPPIPVERWHDTMGDCARMALPLALEDAAKVLHLTVQKDKEGSALVRAVSKPRGKGGEKSIHISDTELERIVRYCHTDVSAEAELFECLCPTQAPDFVSEREVWRLDQTINDRGVLIDMPFVRAAQALIDRASAPLGHEFGALTGLEPGQNAKVLEWCHDRGAELPNLQKDTIDKVLGESDLDLLDAETAWDEDRPDLAGIAETLAPEVRRALEIRRVLGSSSIKKYAAMMATVGPDHRSRHLLVYHGAGPGRWVGRLWQPQNLPRPLFKAPVDLLVQAVMTADPDAVELLTSQEPIRAAVTAVRHAIVSAPGHALLVGDFAQIECRIVLALAGQTDKVKLLASGRDIYLDMAKTIYGREIDKDQDPEERQTGKNSVLGCGFGMGAKTFRARYARNHPLEFCQGVIQAYRQDWAPRVPMLWRALEDAAVDAVWIGAPTESCGVRFVPEGQWLRIVIPSGRSLWYAFPEKEWRQLPWNPDKEVQSWTFGSWQEGRWKRVSAYGGLLTENIVQGLARDLMVHAMMKAEAEGLPVVLTIHDEIVTEPCISRADPHLLEAIMADRPRWAIDMRVPVKAECWAGDRYRKG